MSANIAGALPAGEANGLAAIARELVDSPNQVHVVIALVDCSKITTKTDSGDVIPTARIRRIEAIKDPEDGRRMRMLLRREYAVRAGRGHAQGVRRRPERVETAAAHRSDPQPVGGQTIRDSRDHERGYPDEPFRPAARRRAHRRIAGP